MRIQESHGDSLEDFSRSRKANVEKGDTRTENIGFSSR